MATLQQRALVFEEGTSEKFWSIRVDGSTHTVHFGRIGTAGQVKTKSFDSESDAAASAEKLIAAKLRKGYRDADDPASIPDPVGVAEPAPPEAQPAAPGPTQASAPIAPADDDRPAIDLAPGEWALATWRPAPEPPSSEPPPFDPTVAREALNHVRQGWYWWSWARSPIRFPMTREEAAYWLRITPPLRYLETRSSVTRR